MVGEILLAGIGATIIFTITCDVLSDMRRMNASEKKWQRMVSAATIKK